MSSLTFSTALDARLAYLNQAFQNEPTYQAANTYQAQIDAFDLANDPANRTVERLTSTSVVLAYPAIGNPASVFRVTLSGSGIGPVSTIDTLMTAIDQGLASGSVNRIALTQNTTTLMAMDLTSTGYTVSSGTDRLAVTGALPTSFAQASDMMTLLSAASDMAGLAALSAADRAAFFNELAAYGVTGLAASNASRTLLSFVVTPTSVTLTLDDLRLVATGDFPTNFGTLLSVLFDIDQTFGVSGAPIDLAQIEGLGLTSLVISNAAGQELGRLVDPEAMIRDGYVDTVVINGTAGVDIYSSEGASFATPQMLVDLLGGDDTLLLEEYGPVHYDPASNAVSARRFVGGAGTDLLFIAHYNGENVRVDLAAGQVTISSMWWGGEASIVQVSGFEAVRFGGAYSHAEFLGSAAADVVSFLNIPFAGSSLNGAAGSDTLDLSTVAVSMPQGNFNGVTAANFADYFDIFADGQGGHTILATAFPMPVQPTTLIDFETIRFLGATPGSSVNVSLADLVQTSFSFTGPGSFVGTSLNEAFTGGLFNDSLSGGGGNDRVVGDAGNDSLRGGDGADTLNGGAGQDTIFGGETAADLRDIIYGGDGNDSIDAGYGNDLAFAGLGNDTVEGGFGADELNGQQGDDTLSGGALSDLIYGGDGFDFINGGFGYDRLNGGAGDDRFYHLGVRDHGMDWVQDYTAAQGDVLVAGIAGATRAQFLVQFSTTPGAGQVGVQEAFITYRPTGQVLWALIDGAGQAQINLSLGGQTFDLLA